MQNIQVVCVGTLKERYWREACQEYEKRLGAYCRLRVTELPEARLGGDREGEIRKVLQREGDAMLPLMEGAYNIALCIEGKQMDSPALAARLAEVALQGGSRVNCLIGGSYGLDERVKQRSQLRLSVSPMTFPHQLFRVMLLEQLYRAFSINANGKYHK
ncbi:MAG: 23S rRNA (pseudouridine(1915)-N(3))-methyltransferase RlmH [Eubacteriales bacterium]|jgi:23S rRNA (pseudouridine1915-N3)-methyltransferase